MPFEHYVLHFLCKRISVAAFTNNQTRLNFLAEQGTSPKDKSLYLPLYKAALRGDWESAKAFLDRHDILDAVTAKITAFSTTALHVAVGTGRAIHFVQNLVHLMPPEALALCDELGNTALNVAALVGNTEAAIILVKKNPALLHIRNNRGWLPVHRAALNAHRDTLLYLMASHKEDLVLESLSLTDQSGVELLVDVIDSGFYGKLYFYAVMYTD